jgi:PAS domain S-box-containing protein
LVWNGLFRQEPRGCGGSLSGGKSGSGTAEGAGGTRCPEPGPQRPLPADDLFSRFAGRSWDGIILTDESGSITEWNPAMEQITGRDRAEVLGEKIWDVSFTLMPREKRTPEQLERLKSLVLGMLKTGQVADPDRSTEYEMQRPDGTIRNTDSIMFTIPSKKAFVIGAAIRDTTDRRRSGHAVQEANRKLNLLSSITRHDINNQLTIFNGYLTLLEVGTPTMKSGDIIRILQGATAKIQRILKFTKDYQEIGVKSPVWQDVGETIRSAKSTVEVGGVRFSFGNTCSGIEVFADPLLARVFSNLIDNSLRHGEKVAEIRIHCIFEERRLVIMYEDDGIGISEKIRPILFERGKGKHTGYGLFLIREILTMTGFTLAETGEYGKGARFEIIVPEGAFRMTEKKAYP